MGQKVTQQHLGSQEYRAGLIASMKPRGMLNPVDRGLVEFAAFIVVVAGQTHINPVGLAIGAARSDDVRSGIRHH
jgi:hypothetical protein